MSAQEVAQLSLFGDELLEELTVRPLVRCELCDLLGGNDLGGSCNDSLPPLDRRGVAVRAYEGGGPGGSPSGDYPFHLRNSEEADRWLYLDE